MPEEKEYFIAVYLQDVTELNRYIKENEEQRLVAGLIYIDNYDEVIRQRGGGAPVSSGGAGGPEDQSVYRQGGRHCKEDGER